MKLLSSVICFCLLLTVACQAQNQKHRTQPAIHKNLKLVDGKYQLQLKEGVAEEVINAPKYTLAQAKGKITGSEKGLSFDFEMPEFNGTLYYGFIPYSDSKHPSPVYFKATAPIFAGKAFLAITGNLEGRYDMIHWADNGYGTIGYRIMAENGSLIYDGKVSFKGTGPFEVDVTVIEGPFVDLLESDGATISFETNLPVAASVTVDGKTFSDEAEVTHHEIKVAGLMPDKAYAYSVNAGSQPMSFSLKTAPEIGSKKAFAFAYASDSRNGNGGGERNLYGANFYIMKKIMALCKLKDISFAQFSGDLINGYLNSPAEINLQYANWKRAIEPYTHYIPVYEAMGNHEALMRTFALDRTTFLLDRFPYDTESAEVVFASNFVNPKNGPISEDDASYDPGKRHMDFPSYEENVFFYYHGNVAVIVLNSDYWYNVIQKTIPTVDGNAHGYLMDNQMDWLRTTMASIERDERIDHVFVTQHTPAFPNGGHVGDDMWYRGNNTVRPYVAGKPLAKGIIERRDEYLDILVNQSSKVRAILTGDEHNYARTLLGPETPIYPDDWTLPKVKLSREIFQVNNGAAGAPYYAQEQTPWSAHVSGFTTQNAVVLFHVNGAEIEVEVMNPDTLEEVDTFKLR